MKWIFAVIWLLAYSLTVFAYAKDGKPGAGGGTGSDGSNGTSTVNFIPTNATESYPFYLPILNCDGGVVEGSKYTWEDLRSGRCLLDHPLLRSALAALGLKIRIATNKTS
jgi:hypothetical protein